MLEKRVKNLYICKINNQINKMAKTLTIEESTARKLYRTANDEFKALLEENFGKQFFSEKITDRIKTWEDVVIEYVSKYGKSVSLPNDGRDKLERSINAFYKIQIIATVLNEGKDKSFIWTKNNSQPKYYPYFVKDASGRWAVDFDYCFDLANVGSGLYFATSELALYAGNQFLDIYIDYLPE
jgi:hypothetical protein